jgi:hypothetical protein
MRWIQSVVPRPLLDYTFGDSYNSPRQMCGQEFVHERNASKDSHRKAGIANVRWPATVRKNQRAEKANRTVSMTYNYPLPARPASSKHRRKQRKGRQENRVGNMVIANLSYPEKSRQRKDPHSPNPFQRVHLPCSYSLNAPRIAETIDGNNRNLHPLAILLLTDKQRSQRYQNNGVTHWAPSSL